ncbi:heavy-metal-associated domain-containing protein [Dyadobacter tibetensis]|uniref:heavy-metal-associated domain-containing protein n=1 Tax=Dyadobacter tibetensis TaxID=1211851 RepID=UPI000471A4AD|nr:cation transporter [Dyadobacter tibetensis]
MNNLKFKTNLKCDGCVQAIKPALDQDNKISSWEVDLADPNKTLTVVTDHNPLAIRQLLESAGYQAENISA